MKEPRSRSTSADQPALKRVLRSQAAAVANYDRLSPWYDWLTSSETVYTNTGLDLLAPQPGERILEIGCGTGVSLLELSRRVGPQGQITGLDLSPGMLNVAAARPERSRANAYTLIRGDGRFLPLADNVYPAVFISFTLELFDTPDIPILLQEVKRVMVPGGRLCVVALSREGAGMVGQIYEYLHDHWPVLLDCRPIYPSIALHEAGWSIINRKLMVMWGLPVEIVLAEKD